MDPSVLWADLAECIAEDNWLEAEEHARNLLDWLEKGGFAPFITGTACFDKIVARCACQCIVNWEVD